MRFSLKREQPPPPPAIQANGEDGYEGMLTDEESSYGPMPPPPPPPPPSSDIVALKQTEYDEENAEILQKSAKIDPPIEHADETLDMTQEIDDEETNDRDEPEDVPEEEEEEEHDLRNVPQDDDGEDETEIPMYDDDAESVEIPPTSVVQRMIAEESFQHEKKVVSSTLCRAGTIMTCCLVLLAIILGVGLGTGAFTQDSGTNNEKDSIANGGTNTQRAADIQLYLSSISVVPENIQATDTAESKAVSWLITEDPLSLGAESVEDQFRLGQRYALLAFYFGSSKKWDNETGWLVYEDECDWHGVSCQEEEISTNSTTVNAVTGLELPNNAMNTEIPPDFVLLQSLSTLDVSDNTMEQDLSTYSWKSMVGMEVLRLNGNNFTGDISIFLELPVTLQVLSIGTNGFTGTIPDGLDVFRSLTELNVERNQLSGPISDVVTDLNVTTLRIGDNNFDANGFPVFIYTMTQLEVLGLGAVNINSEIEGALMNLEKLRVLELYGNPLNGTIPNSIMTMTSLEEIIAYDCKFTGPFPDISGWINIEVIQLHDNEFTGTIIDTLSTLTSLRTLSLEGNMLTGTLPITITALQNLEVLDLSKNPMSGELPVDIGGLFSLRELKLNAMIHPDFSAAGLIGTIPTSIGNLARLEVLELRSNFLDGSLPDTLGGLDALRIFDVQFNQLSGQVPDVIGQWNDTITYIELSNNDFTGTIPSTICSTQIETLVADCDVNCTCCTGCVE